MTTRNGRGERKYARTHARTRTHACARVRNTNTQAHALTNKQHTRTHTYLHTFTRLDAHKSALHSRRHARVQYEHASVYARMSEPHLTRAPPITMLSYAYVFVLVFCVRHRLQQAYLHLQLLNLNAFVETRCIFSFAQTFFQIRNVSILVACLLKTVGLETNSARLGLSLCFGGVKEGILLEIMREKMNTLVTYVKCSCPHPLGQEEDLR